MKAHVGVDSHTKQIHAALVPAVNVPYCEAPPRLLYAKETRVRGAQDYQAQTDAIRERAPRAKDFANWRDLHNGEVNNRGKAKHCDKSRVRANVA